jgi:hypothetical protein
LLLSFDVLVMPLNQIQYKLPKISFYFIDKYSNNHLTNFNISTTKIIFSHN